MTITVRRTICLVLLGSASVLPLALAKEPTKETDARDGYHELGRLRAGLAFKAREEEHDSLKASLLYLQAAQAFQRAGEDEYHKALMAGVLAARPLRATWLHEMGAIAATFLPGDKQVLTCAGAGDIRIWDTRTGREARSFKADDAQTPSGRVAGVVFSRDRSRLLLWGFYSVQLWDIAEGKLLHMWKPEPIPQGAAFLHKDEEILIWGDKPPVRLYEVASGKELRTFDKGSFSWHGPILNRQQTRLVTKDGEGVYLWDVAEGKRLHTFAAEAKENSLSAAFTPAGDAVAVFGYADGSTRLVHVASGRRLKSFSTARPSGPVRGVAFAGSSTRLLTWGEDDRTRLWNVADAALLHTFSARRGQARFSPDGKYVLILAEPSVLWDAGDGKEWMLLGAADEALFLPGQAQVLLLGARVELWDFQFHQLQRTFGPAQEAQFNEDRSLLLTLARGRGVGAVRLWDMRQADGSHRLFQTPSQPTSRLFRHSAAVVSAVLSRDEKCLLSCDADGTAHLWDVAKGEEVQSYAHGESGRGAIFSADEARVLTWGGATAKLWQTKSGAAVRTLKNAADLRGCVISPDGTHLLTWDVDYTARWWDLERGEPLRQFEHKRDLFGAILDAKGEHALTWSLDGTAKKWDVRSGQLVWSLKHEGPAFGATYNPDEERVWTWAGDGFHEWDNKTGKALRHLSIKGGVTAAVLDHDGKRFLMRDAQGLVQYWDIAAAKALATFHHVFNVYGFYETVSAGVFAPDRSRALTWAGHGSIKLWDLTSGLDLKTFRHTKAVRGVAFTGDGARVLSWSDDGTVRLWDAFAPRPLSPDDQLLEVETRSGFHIDEHGKMTALSIEEWQECRKKLAAVLHKRK